MHRQLLSNAHALDCSYYEFWISTIFPLVCCTASSQAKVLGPLQSRFQLSSPTCRLSIIQFTVIRRFVIAPDQFLQNDHSIPINTLSYCDMILVPAVLTDKGSQDENQYIDHSPIDPSNTWTQIIVSSAFNLYSSVLV